MPAGEALADALGLRVTPQLGLTEALLLVLPGPEDGVARGELLWLASAEALLQLLPLPLASALAVLEVDEVGQSVMLVLPLTLLLLEGLGAPLLLPWLDADLEALEEVEEQAEGLPELEVPALLLGLCWLDWEAEPLEDWLLLRQVLALTLWPALALGKGLPLTVPVPAACVGELLPCADALALGLKESCPDMVVVTELELLSHMEGLPVREGPGLLEELGEEAKLPEPEALPEGERESKAAALMEGAAEELAMLAVAQLVEEPEVEPLALGTKLLLGEPEAELLGLSTKLLLGDPEAEPLGLST